MTNKSPKQDVISVSTRDCIGGVGSHSVESFRTESNIPVDFRVGRYPSGALRIQGAYPWQQGFSAGGVTWRDLPVVDVNAEGEAPGDA